MSPASEKPRRIAVLSSSRADYAHLYWVLKELDADPRIDLRIIATGAHLAPTFGETISQFREHGFTVEAAPECLLDSNRDVGMAKTIGLAILSLSDILDRLRPDLLLLIADRYEMLAPAATALALRIPMAHIEGGEISEGAIDDAVRNALSKMSHLHFVSTEQARRRLLAMGEEAWRVTRAGAPSLDHLARSELSDRRQLETVLGLDLSSPPMVVAHHPVTLIPEETEREIEALFGALEAETGPVVFCYPNADAGHQPIIDRARAYCQTQPNARLNTNLDLFDFWGLLTLAEVMVGNSSSGIMETPSLALPFVNIGPRQRGRERSANVIDVDTSSTAIRAGIERARSSEFRRSLVGMKSPYGDGNAARTITEVLATCPLGDTLRVKKALALDAAGERFEQAGTGND